MNIKTFFTNDPQALANLITNFLVDCRGMSPRHAIRMRRLSMKLDGGTYGEPFRYHVTEKFTNDAEILEMLEQG